MWRSKLVMWSKRDFGINLYIVVPGLEGSLKTNVQEKQLKNSMVIKKVEFRAPSISHLIVVATAVVPFGKKRVEGKKAVFCYSEVPKRTKIAWPANNFPSLGPLPKNRDTKLQFLLYSWDHALPQLASFPKKHLFESWQLPSCILVLKLSAVRLKSQREIIWGTIRFRCRKGEWRPRMQTVPKGC